MSSNRTSLLFVAFLFIASSISAQFGLRAKYNNNNFGIDQDNSNPLEVDNLFKSNIELGLDYWFRLKEKRVEFMPEVFYGMKSSSVINSSLVNDEINSDHTYYGVGMNVQVYPFDFSGDCDCPTFSKQGPSLKKGFFLALSGGIIAGKFRNELAGITSLSVTYDYFTPRFGLGAGYDIGFSDMFTVSPSVHYSYLPMDVDLQEVGNLSSWSQLQFQLRFGLRFDYEGVGRRR